MVWVGLASAKTEEIFRIKINGIELGIGKMLYIPITLWHATSSRKAGTNSANPIDNVDSNNSDSRHM
jgi:hypothetical protein